jgi:hypothetical protein
MARQIQKMTLRVLTSKLLPSAIRGDIGEPIFRGMRKASISLKS